DSLACQVVAEMAGSHPPGRAPSGEALSVEEDPAGFGGGKLIGHADTASAGTVSAAVARSAARQGAVWPSASLEAAPSSYASPGAPTSTITRRQLASLTRRRPAASGRRDP